LILDSKDTFIREAHNLFKTRDSEFVVKYYDSWIESNVLYIQMELCSQSLRHIIGVKAQIFGRQKDEPMDCVEYYISCHIFRDICECVQYLRTRDPPLIHRDLKPENILIVNNPQNGRFIKLGDFGLCTEHLSTTLGHTRGVGTTKYKAPEVYSGHYNIKADIYSLGVIAMDLLDFDIQMYVSFN